MTEFLRSYTALPNLHPALVHFPVALLMAALMFDIACLVLRRQRWLDPATAALYALGALGAGAAYLAGRDAADSVGRVAPAAQALMAEHSDWAFFTLITFTALGLVRAWISWLDARRGEMSLMPVRFLILAGALAGQGLLFGTADRGGALVFRHGVAVGVPSTAPSASGDRGQPPELKHASEPAPSPAGGLLRGEDGSLLWTPSAADLTAVGTVLRPATGAPESAVRVAPSPPRPAGLPLEVSGSSLLVLPGVFDDVDIEARIDVTGFQGTIGIAHHVESMRGAVIFQISMGGEAALVQLTPGGSKELGRGKIALTPGAITLSLSAAGSHHKGFVDGVLATHGHALPRPPGAVGIFVEGTGTIRLRQFKVTPLNPR